VTGIEWNFAHSLNSLQLGAIDQLYRDKNANDAVVAVLSWCISAYPHIAVLVRRCCCWSWWSEGQIRHVLYSLYAAFSHSSNFFSRLRFCRL